MEKDKTAKEPPHKVTYVLKSHTGWSISYYTGSTDK
jgi:hypothetical protein